MKTGPVDVIEKLTKRVGKKCERMIIHGNGHLEVDFEAPNPWECLVIRVDSWSNLLRILQDDRYMDSRLDAAVIRKKCTKCFMYERRAEPGDLTQPPGFPINTPHEGGRDEIF